MLARVEEVTLVNLVVNLTSQVRTSPKFNSVQGLNCHLPSSMAPESEKQLKVLLQTKLHREITVTLPGKRQCPGARICAPKKLRGDIFRPQSKWTTSASQKANIDWVMLPTFYSKVRTVLSDSLSCFFWQSRIQKLRPKASQIEASFDLEL